MDKNVAPGRSKVSVDRVLDVITLWPGFAAVLLMATIIVSGIVARRFFSPLRFVDEYSSYLLIVVTLLPLSWVARRAQHIRIDLVTGALPRRISGYLHLATNVISVVVLVVLIIATGQFAMTSFARHTVSRGFMATPLGPVQIIIPIGLALLAVQILVQVVKALARGRQQDEGGSR